MKKMKPNNILMHGIEALEAIWYLFRIKIHEEV